DLEFPAHTTRTGETPTATKEHKTKRTHILAYNPENPIINAVIATLILDVSCFRYLFESN
ncbi:MAG: hypothetical protein KHZ37_01335, partial [Bifidobacterium longum]|nr:hypothetical protein [Bifidobacterium longum]